jgi:hypothetical protein
MDLSTLTRWVVRCLLVVLPLLGLGSFTPNGAANVDGPPTATTGGFNENTCRMCHYDYELNDSAGSLQLDGIPDPYTPAQQYLITIRLAHPQLERGGFELAARFATGEQAGRQAGSLEAVDERVAVVNNNNPAIQYASHTRTGSSPEAKGTIRWSVRWRAPADPLAPVVFHAAANAANYDDSPLGDFPYVREITTRPMR